MKPGVIDPTDVLALVLMAVFSMRRMDVRATEARAFPQIPVVLFDAWKARALRAKSLSIHACFLKFALNSVWLWGFGSHVIPPVLMTGGWLLFLGWVGALVYGSWLSAVATKQGEHLGIVLGRRAAAPDPKDQARASSEEGEASSH